MSYFLMAFADEKTYSAHGLLCFFIRSSSSSARFLYRRKFSSMMKKEVAPSWRSAWPMTVHSCSPPSKKLTTFPLPPKHSDVVQKLHPIGQPTDGMMVADASPPPLGIGIPISLKPNDDGMSGCSIGRSTRSPRKPRSHATPSPLTM